jgi:hypothetical protein
MMPHKIWCNNVVRRQQAVNVELVHDVTKLEERATDVLYVTPVLGQRVSPKDLTS